MLFNSFSFAVFFPVVFIVYYLLPERFRRLFLLLASMYFYMSFVPWYILILFLVIIVDFTLGPLIEQSQGHKRRAYLTVSILVNLGILFVFKYFNFFNANIASLAHALGWHYSIGFLSLILPIGLSFHVFQSLSYVIEVYRGTYKAERDPLTYALYVMFFPQLVAGPIERPGHLLPQLHMKHPFDAVRTRRGLERMLWGFFKKLVIADQIGVIVNMMWATLPTDSTSLIILAILFAYQIYCDFSGYSDIAIGTAMMLGVELTENFNRPYASRSVSEFWRRWHMSLSNWLRDYLFVPMVRAKKRATVAWVYFSSFATFVLIGLWHGANWTYVIFGALNGFYIFFGAITSPAREWLAKLFHMQSVPRLRCAIQIAITFALFCFCLIFFRAPDVHAAWRFVSHLLSDFGDIAPWRERFNAFAQPDKIRFAIFLIGIAVLEGLQYMQSQAGTFYAFDRYPRAVRYAWYYTLIFAMLLFGYFKAQPFIYFQF